jgi:hypothetical protein
MAIAILTTAMFSAILAMTVQSVGSTPVCSPKGPCVDLVSPGHNLASSSKSSCISCEPVAGSSGPSGTAAGAKGSAAGPVAADSIATTLAGSHGISAEHGQPECSGKSEAIPKDGHFICAAG